jgi:hypothetical protein
MVCPTRCIHNLGSTDLIVCRVAITLEYVLEVAQEPFGPFLFPPHQQPDSEKAPNFWSAARFHDTVLADCVSPNR